MGAGRGPFLVCNIIPCCQAEEVPLECSLVFPRIIASTLLADLARLWVMVRVVVAALSLAVQDGASAGAVILPLC